MLSETACEAIYPIDIEEETLDQRRGHSRRNIQTGEKSRATVEQFGNFISPFGLRANQSHFLSIVAPDGGGKKGDVVGRKYGEVCSFDRGGSIAELSQSMGPNRRRKQGRTATHWQKRDGRGSWGADSVVSMKKRYVTTIGIYLSVLEETLKALVKKKACSDDCHGRWHFAARDHHPRLSQYNEEITSLVGLGGGGQISEVGAGTFDSDLTPDRGTWCQVTRQDQLDGWRHVPRG